MIRVRLPPVTSLRSAITQTASGARSGRGSGSDAAGIVSAHSGSGHVIPKSQKVVVGSLVCGALGLLTLVAVERVLSAMRRECVVDSSVGDGLGFLIAAPSILFGTMAVTGVLFALTVSLVQRAWSVYAAIGAAVLAAAVVVAVAVSCVYDTGTANDSCPNGIPHFGWPLPV